MHLLACQVVVQPRTLGAYAMRSLALTWAGVDLFFVLSGFLIGGILLQNRQASNYFKTFYIRRLCRIFPLYYGVLAAFGLFVYWDGPALCDAQWLSAEPIPPWTYVLFVQNCAMAAYGTHGPNWLGTTWSLAVEEQFYLLLPLLIRVTSIRVLVAVLSMLILTAPILRGAVLSCVTHGGIAGYVLLPTRWDSLFLGVLGAVVVHHYSATIASPQHYRRLTRTLWACAIVIALLLAAGQGIGSWAMAWFGHTVIALASLALVLVVAVFPECRIAAIFRNRLLRAAGAVSYGLYLLHQPIAGIFHGIFVGQQPRIGTLSDFLVTLTSLAFTVAAATASWLLFERHFVALGQRARYDS